MSSDEDLSLSGDDNETIPEKKAVTGLKHIEEMKGLFSLKDLKSKTRIKRERRQRRKERKKTAKGVIETLATKAGNHPLPEVHVFVTSHKNPKQIPILDSSEKQEPSKITTMKEARFDVFKFGLSGFDKAKKEDAETALAIRLGAKPPKNKCLPYEEFKKIRKVEKEELKQKIKLKNSFASKKKKPATAKKSDKKRTESIQTKVGKFDGGMLRLSASDIKKIKGA